MKKRVVVGLSGGVDSSVAAALLQKDGYDVVGVYILGWLGDEQFPCDWQKEEADARAVAEHLNIPFYTINLSKEYETAVIDAFFERYAAGQTPNPDILCNSEIKFKALWKEIRQFEPDFLATGHYARIIGQEREASLLKGVDPNKDQSYFLWNIDRGILAKILFPVGEYTKPVIRQLARELGLPTAAKKDSQGICFVGPLKVREFLRTRLQTKSGEAVLADGRVVAIHQGVQLYTIGQRLGAGTVNWTGDAPPLFVVGKNLATNQLLVGPDAATYRRKLQATSCNWLVQPPTQEFECLAKIRYRQEDVSVAVTPEGETISVTFAEPVRAITPGQSIVFYAPNGQVLGGAIISE